MIPITELDKNFKIKKIDKQDAVFFDVTQPPFKLYGITKIDEGFTRMPISIADSVSIGVRNLCTNTAGGRVRFKTNSKYIALKALMRSVFLIPNMSLSGSSSFDVYVDGKYSVTFMPEVPWDNGRPTLKDVDGVEGILEFEDSKMRDILINFPLYNNVLNVYVGVENTATIEAGNSYMHQIPVVFYGSSITQGGCATKPGNSYQAILSRRLDFDYINLGFSGNAKAEQEMAEYIATLDMSVFVYDYDHNAPTVKYLEQTHYAMYKTIRNAQPTLPIIMASAIRRTNDTADWIARRDIIRNSYNRAIAEGDNYVSFIDGSTMHDLYDSEIVTCDGTHPNDFGFYCMAELFEKELKKYL